MKRSAPVLLVAFSIVFKVFAGQLELGTPQEFIDEVLKQNTRSTSVLVLPTCCAGNMDLYVENYYYKDGELLLEGKSLAVPNSAFMLKGDKNEIYGWIHLIDSDVVYRYSTDNSKNVIVEQVPLSAILVVEDMTPPTVMYEDTEPDLFRGELPDIVHINPYTSTVDAKNLESRKGSSKVIYIDLVSQSFNKTAAEIYGFWQYHAAGFSMFDVNVTTSQSVYNATSPTSRGIAVYYTASGRSNCYVKGFGTSSGCKVYWQQNIRGTGLTGTHEMGHLVAVLDAGHTTQGTYFEGLAAFKWVPIMGNYWMANNWEPNALYTWSKGEYTGANSAAKQDFFQYAQEKLTLLPDDITTAKALIYKNSQGLLSARDNYGRIGPNGDVDEFSFEISEATGSADIVVSPIEKLVMLDIHAMIIDASGATVVEDNKQAIRISTLKASSLQKGKYTLRVKGGAEGTPANGFSNYGSVGFFGITGTITGGATGAITPKMVALNQVKIIPLFAGSQIRIDIPKENNVRKIAVYSIDGKQVFLSNERVSSIDFSDFASGIYTVNVDIDGMIVNSKVIKK